MLFRSGYSILVSVTILDLAEESYLQHGMNLQVFITSLLSILVIIVI